MSVTTVVVCEDAGAAEALAPVVAVLQAREVPLRWWLGPAALQVMRDRGLRPVDGVGEIDRTCSLLHGTTAWGQRIEARAVVKARALGARSLGFMDFWSNYEARLSYPEVVGLGALPDRLAVIDEAMRDSLLAIGVPPDRLVVTGSPAFEGRSLDVANGVPAERRVLFLSQPIQALYGRSQGYTERTVISALAAITAEVGCELVVRCHPREDLAAMRGYLASLPNPISLDESPDLATAVRASRVVVGMTTVALMHAALLGVPAVSAQLGAQGEDPLPSNRLGLTVRVTTPAELRVHVAAGLQNAVRVAPASTWGAGATERVVREWERL